MPRKVFLLKDLGQKFYPACQKSIFSRDHQSVKYQVHGLWHTKKTSNILMATCFMLQYSLPKENWFYVIISYVRAMRFYVCRFRNTVQPHKWNLLIQNSFETLLHFIICCKKIWWLSLIVLWRKNPVCNHSLSCVYFAV